MTTVKRIPSFPVRLTEALFVLTASAAFGGCNNSASTSQVAFSSDEASSEAESVFAKIVLASSQPAFKDQLESIRTLSFSSFYGALSSQLSDDSVAVAGDHFSGLKTAFSSDNLSRMRIQNLNGSASIGAFLSAHGALHDVVTMADVQHMQNAARVFLSERNQHAVAAPQKSATLSLDDAADQTAPASTASDASSTDVNTAIIASAATSVLSRDPSCGGK